VCANISKTKLWQYSLFLSTFIPETRIGAHNGVGAFTKSAKARILYMESKGKLRADDWSTMVMSPQPCRKHERTVTWPESLGRFTHTFATQRIGFQSRRAGRDGRRPSRKLPSTAILCHFVATKPLHSLQPFHSLRLEGMHANQSLVFGHRLLVLGTHFPTEAGGRMWSTPKGDAPRSLSV
jgi:hypothetical protein